MVGMGVWGRPLDEPRGVDNTLMEVLVVDGGVRREGGAGQRVRGMLGRPIVADGMLEHLKPTKVFARFNLMLFLV